MHCVVRAGHADATIALRKRGGSVNIPRTRDWKTAADLASGDGQVRVLCGRKKRYIHHVGSFLKARYLNSNKSSMDKLGGIRNMRVPHTRCVGIGDRFLEEKQTN